MKFIPLLLVSALDCWGLFCPSSHAPVSIGDQTGSLAVLATTAPAVHVRSVRPDPDYFQLRRRAATAANAVTVVAVHGLNWRLAKDISGCQQEVAPVFTLPSTNTNLMGMFHLN